MYQDLIVILLIAFFAGLGAIVILRVLWKTKRSRRPVARFTLPERGAAGR